MNDPRQPVQPAPAAPAMPRTTPHAPHAPAQQTMPRPAGTPAHAHAPAHPAHPQQQPRPAGMPAHHASNGGQHAPQQFARPMQSPAPVAAPPPIPRAAPPLAKPDEEAIALEDADDDLTSAPATPAPSKIKFGAEIGVKKHAWKRQLKQGGMGACRVRTFHGKLSDQGLEYIDEAINVWLDDHPEIDIKFVTTNVGMFDGKFKDLALVVNVWY